MAQSCDFMLCPSRVVDQVSINTTPETVVHTCSAHYDQLSGITTQLLDLDELINRFDVPAAREIWGCEDVCHLHDFKMLYYIMVLYKNLLDKIDMDLSADFYGIDFVVRDSVTVDDNLSLLKFVSFNNNLRNMTERYF